MPRDPKLARPPDSERSLYQPYYVEGPYDKRYAVTVFARDPRTGFQVWSGDNGYPGDPTTSTSTKSAGPAAIATGSVTGPGVDMGDKQPYYPQRPPNASRSTPATSSPSSTRRSRPASTTASRPCSARPSTPNSSATGGSKACDVAGDRLPRPPRTTTTGIATHNRQPAISIAIPRAATSPCPKAPGAPKATTRSG